MCREFEFSSVFGVTFAKSVIITLSDSQAYDGKMTVD
jgi:hypothetical protein